MFHLGLNILRRAAPSCSSPRRFANDGSSTMRRLRSSCCPQARTYAANVRIGSSSLIATSRSMLFRRAAPRLMLRRLPATRQHFGPLQDQPQRPLAWHWLDAEHRARPQAVAVYDIRVGRVGGVEHGVMIVGCGSANPTLEIGPNVSPRYRPRQFHK